MTLKKKFVKMCYLSFILFNTFSTFAQEAAEHLSKFSFGVHLGNYKSSQYAGINFTSPYFAQRTMAVRLTANFASLEFIETKKFLETESFTENVDYKLSPYGVIQLGLTMKSDRVADMFYPYMDFRVTGIIPNKDFAKKTSLKEDFPIGGFMVWGIEFITPAKKSLLFIEMGFGTVETKAEKAVGQPYYARGFMIATGLRAYLGKKSNT